MMNGGLISWKSRRQVNVCLSTSEAKFVAASQARQEALFLEILKDLGYQQRNTIEIYEDNLAYVAVGENPVRRKFSRHINIHRYFVRELVKAGFVKLIPLRTHETCRRCPHQKSAFACLHRPPPRHDDPNTFCFQVIALKMCLVCLRIYFHHFSRLIIFFGLPNVLYKCPHCAWGTATQNPLTT